MTKKTVMIDESKCNACCMCVSACHEGAIGLIGGKAKLLNDQYCNERCRCIKICPMKAITFEEIDDTRKDDKNAVINEIENKLKVQVNMHYSSAAKNKINREPEPVQVLVSAPAPEQKQAGTNHMESQLNQWPVQIKLIPPNAPCFNNADLLVAAECTAYAYANFHGEYMKNRITIIGCPKLDDEDYSEKLADIFKANSIKSVMVARMEVPCCEGIESAVENALHISGNLKLISKKVVIISKDGKIAGH